MSCFPIPNLHRLALAMPNIPYRDLNLPQLSNLAIQQQKKQQESANISSPRLQNNAYQTRPLEPPMPAPVPTRAAVPPPAVQSPGAVPGMWSPDMGIKFGSVGPAGSSGDKPLGGRAHGAAWDPSSGVRFG